MTAITVESVMVRDVVVLNKEQSLPLAKALMEFRHIHHLPVIDGNRVVGVVTYENVLAEQLRRQSLEPSPNMADDALDVPVECIMQDAFEVASPDETVANVARRMSEANLDCFPVVSNEELVGIVTAVDCLALLAGDPDRFEAGRAEDPVVFRNWGRHTSVQPISAETVADKTDPFVPRHRRRYGLQKFEKLGVLVFVLIFFAVIFGIFRILNRSASMRTNEAPVQSLPIRSNASLPSDVIAEPVQKSNDNGGSRKKRTLSGAAERSPKSDLSSMLDSELKVPAFDGVLRTESERRSQKAAASQGRGATNPTALDRAASRLVAPAPANTPKSEVETKRPDASRSKVQPRSNRKKDERKAPQEWLYDRQGEADDRRRHWMPDPPAPITTL